jgi:hypothetical protein
VSNQVSHPYKTTGKIIVYKMFLKNRGHNNSLLSCQHGQGPIFIHADPTAVVKTKIKFA